MAFEFLVKLNDMVSDPAQKISRAMFEVEQRLRSLDILSKTASIGPKTSSMKRAQLELQIQRLQLERLRQDMLHNVRVSSTLADRFRHLRESTRDWLLILTPLAMGLKFIFNQAQQLAHAVVAPIRALEEASIGLRTMFGTAIGNELLQGLTELGPRIGRPIKELFTEAMKLSTAGVPSELIQPMLLALADMQAMGRDTSKLQYDLAATFSRPVADLNEMRRGLTGVIDESLVWAQLAKDIGVSVGNVNFLMSKNMISGKALGVAILEVIQQLEGGKLGSKAFERADTTMGGMLDRITARMEKLFMGMADTPGFVTLKKALTSLFDVLSDPKTQGLFNDLANSIGRMLEPLTTPEGKQSMMDFFDSMRAAIESLLGPLEGVARFIGFLVKYDRPRRGILQDWLETDNAAQGIRNIIANEQAFRYPHGFKDPGYKGAELTNTPEDPNDTYTIGDTTFRKKIGHPTDSSRGTNITIPIIIDETSLYGRGVGEVIPKEVRDEALRKLAETLDQINSQSP